MGETAFRWNEWNREHATRHGCTVDEIESVVRRGGRGYPRSVDSKKWVVVGRGIGDRVIRVIYVIDPDRTIYVIHAMPLTMRRRR